MEAGYHRAKEEQPASQVNHLGEVILLEAKIAFWRQRIPEAAGVLEGHEENYLLVQRAMQHAWAAARGGGRPVVELLHGDLIGWRQRDLHQWAIERPGVWPAVALPVEDDDAAAGRA